MDRMIRLLNIAQVEQVLSMSDVLRLVEQALLERANGRTQMPPKSYLYFPQHSGDLRVMPAYLARSRWMPMRPSATRRL